MKFGVFTMGIPMGAGSPEQNFYHKFQSSEKREGKIAHPHVYMCAPKSKKAKIVSIADRRDGTMASNPKTLGLTFCCAIWLLVETDSSHWIRLVSN
jgi:hypothetical protein